MKTIKVNCEFASELVCVIPYANWLQQNNQLEKVITSRGMTPFYYFCDDVEERFEIRTFDINTNALSMTGVAHVTFQFEVEGIGTVIPIDKTGDPADVDFEVVKYQLEAIDSGLREAGANDSFELKLMFNSADSAGLYSVFGESETFSGNLSTAEITIEKSER